jgi:hypothetical protein
MWLNNQVMKILIAIMFIVTSLLLQMATNAVSQDSTLYMSPSAAVAKGKAPGMTWKLLSDNNGVKEYAIVFAKDDEVLSGTTGFAVQQHVASARFTAIGALKEGTFGWFDPKRNQYKLNTIRQQIELVSLIGDIANYNGIPVVHTHCSVALADGSMQGGHLVKAITYPTVELFMTVFSTPLQKTLDNETGLKLIQTDLK